MKWAICEDFFDIGLLKQKFSEWQECSKRDVCVEWELTLEF